MVVVGAGFTGLSAAYQLARRGRQTVVLDRDGPGRGASGRNGGMAHPGAKHDLATLLATPGGRAQWEATVSAYDELWGLVSDLEIDCRWERTGHLELAHHRRQTRVLQAAARAHQLLGEDARFVDAAELSGEIGSSCFAGGLAVERSAAVQPAALVAGLLAGAEGAGATVCGGIDVLAVERDGGGGGKGSFTVRTSTGVLEAGEVVLATGATTADLAPWVSRRLLPVGSFIVATEALDEELAHSVSPKGRMFFDTRNFLNYWRLSPDRRRVLFGGRTSFAPTTVEHARDLLYADMVRVHPQLAGVRVERAWGGLVDLTVDRAPHIGRDPRCGAVYAAGYSGTGVVLSVHLGAVAARWLCGEEVPPVFAGPGTPWRRVPAVAQLPGGLRLAGWWYRGRDALGL